MANVVNGKIDFVVTNSATGLTYLGLVKPKLHNLIQHYAQ
jgi:hypothetical protein